MENGKYSMNDNGSYPMNNNGSFVVVINRNISIPLRHIVHMLSNYKFDETKFAKWYYENFVQIEGDEFIFCKTRAEKDAFVANLEKEDISCQE